MDEKLAKKSLMDTIKHMVFFPRIVFIVVPVLILISLFFVPMNYSGFFTFAKTMNGTSQKKWLFDMFNFYCIAISAITFFKYFLIGLPPHASKLIIDNFYHNGKYQISNK